MRNHGEKLNWKQLEYLLNNFEISNHAKEKILERKDFLYSENIDFMKRKIRDFINRSNPLAYFNTDYSVNIGINKYEYFVFKYCKEQYKYLMITFKEKSQNGYSVFKKYILATKGKVRINKRG